MIHFSVTAMTSEGWSNVGRILHRIGQNGLYVPGDISEAGAVSAKLIIFH